MKCPHCQCQTDIKKALIELGAKLEKREDENGETRSGWWLDSVWLAPANKPRQALGSIKG